MRVDNGVIENSTAKEGQSTGLAGRGRILDLAVSQSPVIFTVAAYGAPSQVKFISANVERITGHEVTCFLGDPRFIERHVHPNDVAAFAAGGDALRRGGEATREYRLATSTGEYLWFREELRLNRRSGEVDEVVGCLINITDERRAEQRLRDAEALKSAITDAALNAIVVVDEGGTILEFNPMAERTFGYSRRQVIGRRLDEMLIPEADRAAHRNGLRRFLATGEGDVLNRNLQVNALRADGDVFPAELNISEVTFADRRVFVAELWDASEHVRARKERDRMSNLLNDAVQSSTTGVAIYDALGRLMLSNAAYSTFFDEDPATILGSEAEANHRRAMKQLVSWAGGAVDLSDAGLAASFARLYATEGPPIEMQHKDGRWMQVVTRATAEGGWVLVRTDITRLKQREAALREAQEVLEDAVGSLADGFALYDSDDRLVMCNQKYRDDNQVCADRLVPGTTWADIVRTGAERGQYPDAVGRVDEWLAERVKQRAELWPHLELEQSDGQWYQFAYARTRNGGTVVTRSNITRHKALLAALEENEALIRKVVESSPMPVVMARADDGIAIYESPAFKSLFGGKREADGQRRALDYYVDAERRDRLIALLRRTEAVDRQEVELKKANGERFWASVSARLIDLKGEEVIVSSIYDLTERRIAEEEVARQREALRESDQRFRRLLEAYPVPVGMTRAADGEVIYESPAAQTLFQRVAGRVSARDHFVDPEERQAYLSLLREKGGVTDYQVALKKADGTPFQASISARLIDYEGAEVIVSSVFDLTERRSVEAELARQREALYQSEKLAALGSLLAGVAHELNNPLSVVVGQAQLLQETARDQGAAARAAKIGKAADRCSRIVRTFLAMARQQPTQRVAVDVNEIVNATLDVTGYSLRTAGVDVVLGLNEDMPLICADPDQLHQVFTNLIVNAQQAMTSDGGGELRITSALDTTKGGVVLAFQDTGPGITADNLPRVFEPFFTTKQVGDGTGIGLSVCHKIIEGLGGEITVDSKPGAGATFSIALPVMAGGTCEDGTGSERKTIPGSCRVLVIDDEPEVIRMLGDILVAAGHDVTTSDSGERALRLLARQEFDVILCDLRMPGMNGPQLYETLGSLSPRLAVRFGFITGDTFSASMREFLRDSGRPYAQKPFTPEEIKSLVGEVLADVGGDIRRT